MSAAITPICDRPESHVCDLDAERAVLGAVVLANDVAGWLDLSERDFFAMPHRAIWRAVVALHADGTPIDPVTLEAHLARSGQSEIVGGLPALSELALSVPTADNVEFYAEILRRKRINRDVTVAADRAQGLLKGGVEGEELLDEVLGEFGRIDVPAGDEAASAQDAVAEEMLSIARNRSGEQDLPTLATGLDRLDALTDGGIPIGPLTVLAGAPGAGKTTLLLAILDYVTSNPDNGAILFSYEDRRSVLARKLLSKYSEIPYTKIRTRQLSDTEMALLEHVQREFLQRPNLRIVHAHGLQAHEIVRIAKSWSRKIQLRITAVDYVQNMPTPRGRWEKRTYALEENLRIVDDLGAQLSVGNIAASQLNRPDRNASVPGDATTQERIAARRPTYERLKDSSALDQKGKLILAINADRELGEKQREILILKQNEGPTNKVIPIEVDLSTSRIVRCIPPNQNSLIYPPHPATAEE